MKHKEEKGFIGRIVCILLAGLFLNGLPTVFANDLQKIDIPKANHEFTDSMADITYDFSKLKKAYVLDTDVNLSNEVNTVDTNEVRIITEKNVKKRMKYKLVDKEQADIFVQPKITEWQSKFEYRVPERVTYEAYESYEKWEEPSPEAKRRWEEDKQEAAKAGRKAPPPPRPRLIVKPTWFYGSKRVITPDDREGYARRIVSDTSFPGSEKVTHPAYNVYSASVTAVINLIDPKTNEVVMSRKGKITSESRYSDNQMAVYEKLCKDFGKDYKKVLKQIKKIVKNENRTIANGGL